MASGKKLVLVVDDDRDLLAMFELLLDSGEIEVCLASNGAEALELIERQAPALVFLDMRMPVMNGQEFARRLRERHGNEVPVIVLSASLDGRQQAEEIGAQDFLAKPFELNDLFGKVQHHLGNFPAS